jgi:arylsulfatase A-like enzyme
MPRYGYFSPWGNPRLADGPGGEYLDDRLTDEAVRLIHSRDRGRPFFLNFCFYLVHIPIQPKPELLERHTARAAALGLDRRDPFETGEHFPCEHKKHLHVIRRLFQSDPGYAAMVQAVDDNVGRLLGALEEEGIADETIVLFTSDNGGLATAEGSPTCNTPLAEGKGWLYEGGTRDPLIVRWPGVTRPGAVSDVPVTSPDFYPTLLDMTGLPPRPEQHVDGRSFARVLTGERAAGRDDIFWHFPHYANQGGTPGCSILRGDWKLIEFFEEGRLELYNLKDDVSEDRKIAGEHADLTHELRDSLHAWLTRIGARIPRPNPDWKPAEDPPR